MGIILGEPDDERRHILGKPVFIGGIVSEQHLSRSGYLGGGLGSGAAILAGHENVDLTGSDFLCGCNRVEGCGLQHPVVMFGDDQSSHQITRASVFSLSTSSATEPTLWPPWRFAGSSTLSTTRRGAGSTPSASGVVVTIGFFLALMILGSEA